MQWNKNLSTGNNEIDEQLKQLFKETDIAMIEVIKKKNQLFSSEPLGDLNKIRCAIPFLNVVGRG